MAFCVAVVTLYSKITGNDNSVVGVTVLLAVLVLRQADFGIRTTHGLLSIAGIFGILIIRSATVQYGFTGAGIFCKRCKYPFADDPGMPQCNYV